MRVGKKLGEKSEFLRTFLTVALILLVQLVLAVKDQLISSDQWDWLDLKESSNMLRALG